MLSPYFQNQNQNQGQSQGSFSSFFPGALEEDPRLAFFSSPSGQSFSRQSPAKRSFFQDQFQNFFNQYLGDLGGQIRAGGSPTLQFSDFLDNSGQNRFSTQFSQLPPSLRPGGFGRQRFNPRTRLIFS